MILQHGLTHAQYPFRRRHPTDYLTYWYRRLRAMFHMNTLSSKLCWSRATSGFNCIQEKELHCIKAIPMALESEREMSRARCLQTVRTQGEAVRYLHYRSSCVRPSRTCISERCSEKVIPRRLWNYGRVDEAKGKSRMSRRPVCHTGSYRE